MASSFLCDKASAHLDPCDWDPRNPCPGIRCDVPCVDGSPCPRSIVPVSEIVSQIYRVLERITSSENVSETFVAQVQKLVLNKCYFHLRTWSKAVYQLYQYLQKEGVVIKDMEHTPAALVFNSDVLLQYDSAYLLAVISIFFHGIHVTYHPEQLKFTLHAGKLLPLELLPEEFRERGKIQATKFQRKLERQKLKAQYLSICENTSELSACLAAEVCYRKPDNKQRCEGVCMVTQKSCIREPLSIEQSRTWRHTALTPWVRSLILPRFCGYHNRLWLKQLHYFFERVQTLLPSLQLQPVIAENIITSLLSQLPSSFPLHTIPVLWSIVPAQKTLFEQEWNSQIRWLLSQCFDGVFVSESLHRIQFSPSSSSHDDDDYYYYYVEMRMNSHMKFSTVDLELSSQARLIIEAQRQAYQREKQTKRQDYPHIKTISPLSSSPPTANKPLWSLYLPFTYTGWSDITDQDDERLVERCQRAWVQEGGKAHWKKTFFPELVQDPPQPFTHALLCSLLPVCLSCHNKSLTLSELQTHKTQGHQIHYIRRLNEYQAYNNFLLQKGSPVKRLVAHWKTGAGKSTLQNAYLTQLYQANKEREEKGESIRPIYVLFVNQSELQTLLKNILNKQMPNPFQDSLQKAQLLYTAAANKSDPLQKHLAETCHLMTLNIARLTQPSVVLKKALAELSDPTKELKSCDLLFDEFHRFAFDDMARKDFPYGHASRMSNLMCNTRNKMLKYGVERGVHLLALTGTLDGDLKGDTSTPGVVDKALFTKQWEHKVLPLLSGKPCIRVTSCEAPGGGSACKQSACYVLQQPLKHVGNYVSHVLDPEGMPRFRCGALEEVLPILVPVPLLVSRKKNRSQKTERTLAQEVESLETMIPNMGSKYLSPSYNMQNEPKLNALLSHIIQWHHQERPTIGFRPTLVLTQSEKAVRLLNYILKRHVKYKETFITTSSEKTHRSVHHKGHNACQETACLQRDQISFLTMAVHSGTTSGQWGYSTEQVLNQDKPVVEDAIAQNHLRLILGRAKYSGTGMDIPGLERVILLSPPDNWANYIQWMGRVTRLCASKPRNPQEKVVYVQSYLFYYTQPESHVLTADELMLQEVYEQEIRYKSGFWSRIFDHSPALDMKADGSSFYETLQVPQNPKEAPFNNEACMSWEQFIHQLRLKTQGSLNTSVPPQSSIKSHREESALLPPPPTTTTTSPTLTPPPMIAPVAPTVPPSTPMAPSATTTTTTTTTTKRIHESTTTTVKPLMGSMKATTPATPTPPVITWSQRWKQQWIEGIQQKLYQTLQPWSTQPMTFVLCMHYPVPTRLQDLVLQEDFVVCGSYTEWQRIQAQVDLWVELLLYIVPQRLLRQHTPSQHVSCLLSLWAVPFILPLPASPPGVPDLLIHTALFLQTLKTYTTQAEEALQSLLVMEVRL